MERTSDNGARTHSRSRGCDSSLLVAWKAPAGVLGNEAIVVASEAQLSAFEAVSGLWRRPVLSESMGSRIAQTRPWRRSAI
jgi:hypothetical protein